MARSLSRGLALDDLGPLGFHLGCDLNGAWLHGLWQLAQELHMQQAVLEARTLHDDKVGELEAPLEAARSDAAMQEFGVLLVDALVATN